MNTTLRHATMSDLVAMLREQQDIKYDVVVAADQLYYDPTGNLNVVDGTTEVSPDGVTLMNANLRPTEIFEGHISQKLGIPRKYLDRMRNNGELPLLANNVNTWLHHDGDADKRWFVRGFLPDEGQGIARAFLSDRYKVIDHLDTLTAALDGIARCNTPTTIGRCNLTDRQMYVEIEAPEVRAMAPKLLENYRSPFSGASGADNPVVFAGFILSNSETGAGAFTLTPRLRVQVCNNGMQMNVDAMRQIHLGTKMTEGEVRWSDETRHHYIELVKGQVKDAVTTFLSQDYIDAKIADLEDAAAVSLENPRKAVERVTVEMRYSQAEQDAVLDLFVSGGDTRAVGVMHAVTAMAQTLDDADRAYEVEGDAVRVLELAQRFANV